MNKDVMSSNAVRRYFPKPSKHVRLRPPVRYASAMIAIGLTVFSISATGNKPPYITDAEMALIPAYCKDANTFGGYGGTEDSMSPNAPKWVAAMGKGFWAIHHYCWALINLMRLQSPSVPPNVKAFERQTALDDMGYVIQNSPSDFILLPEIYTKMGEIQLDLKAAGCSERVLCQSPRDEV